MHDIDVFHLLTRVKFNQNELHQPDSSIIWEVIFQIIFKKQFLFCQNKKKKKRKEEKN